MILWIASYPKSGNTWLRALLSTYYYTKDGIFSDDKILGNIGQFPEKKYFTNFKYDPTLPGDTSKLWIEAQNKINSDKKIKFYQASSSEMYGGSSQKSLNEESVFDPKSPYAASKVFAHNVTKLYRDSYDIFGVNGILFNHESPLRGETFVTRKITRSVARISLGIQSQLTLGNLEASRDWGFAGDYVEGMWLMMQHNQADDWVLATGKTYTVQEFVDSTFKLANLEPSNYVKTSEKYFRPNEVDYLLGDYSKAKKILNWEPKTTFEELVKMMFESDLELAKREQVLMKNNLLVPTWESPVLNN